MCVRACFCAYGNITSATKEIGATVPSMSSTTQVGIFASYDVVRMRLAAGSLSPLVCAAAEESPLGSGRLRAGGARDASMPSWCILSADSNR
eukprot:365535-Chlamydomonas_euryale.AAC.39